MNIKIFALVLMSMIMPIFSFCEVENASTEASCYSDPLVFLAQVDPIGFIRQKLVTKPKEIDAFVSKYAKIASLFAVISAVIGGISLYILLSPHLGRTEYAEFYREELWDLSVGGCIVCFWSLSFLLGCALNKESYVRAFANFLDCYSKDDVVFTISGETYGNNRKLIPQELVPFFDALYEQYKKNGTDYLSNRAQEITKILAHWCSVHAECISDDLPASLALDAE